jgi:hypothetical protein
MSTNDKSERLSADEIEQIRKRVTAWIPGRVAEMDDEKWTRDPSLALAHINELCDLALKGLAPSAARPQGPDGYALLFMPGTEHFCYVGIWTKREPAEHMLSKTRGGDSRIAPMYFAAPSASESHLTTPEVDFLRTVLLNLEHVSDDATVRRDAKRVREKLVRADLRRAEGATKNG